MAQTIDITRMGDTGSVLDDQTQQYIMEAYVRKAVGDTQRSDMLMKAAYGHEISKRMARAKGEDNFTYHPKIVSDQINAFRQGVEKADLIRDAITKLASSTKSPQLSPPNEAAEGQDARDAEGISTKVKPGLKGWK